VSWASTKVEEVTIMSARVLVLSRAQTAAALVSAMSTTVYAGTMAAADFLTVIQGEGTKSKVTTLL
jgi:hypothetical protein